MSRRVVTVTAPSLDACAAPRSQEERDARSDGLAAAYGLAWAAGAIHLTAALEHSGEHPSHAASLAFIACAQLLWGIALYRSPTRRLLLAGVMMSIAMVALWVASRTSGLPIGATPWRPEPVGALDSVASADATVLAVLVGLRLSFELPRWASRCLDAVSVFLILLSSLVLTQLAHGH